jgi:hypothetical protein
MFYFSPHCHLQCLVTPVTPKKATAFFREAWGNSTLGGAFTWRHWDDFLVRNGALDILPYHGIMDM